MSQPKRRRHLTSALIALGALAVLGGGGIIYYKAKAGAAPAEASSQAPSTTSETGVAAASIGTKPEAEKKAPIPVAVTSIATGAVSSYISSTANLITENEVKVLAEADGRVAEMLVEEGLRVSKGQVLASLASEDAEIAVNKAQLRATNTRLAYERGVKALAEDLLSRETFDKVSMDKEIAEQELAEAKWKLEKTTIRAPFAGRVTGRTVMLGQHVKPGDILFSVADFDPLIARIYLPEKDVYGLNEGRDVRITLKADESTRFPGRIRQISPVVDTGTGTVKVTIEAAALAPPGVRPGAFVTIDIVRETHPKALLVPREAIIRELQEAYVFVAKGDIAEKRTVSLGLEEADLVEALSGVAAGDQVIVAGQGGLKDGTPIKVIPPSATTQMGPMTGMPAQG